MRHHVADLGPTVRVPAVASTRRRIVRVHVFEFGIPRVTIDTLRLGPTREPRHGYEEPPGLIVVFVVRGPHNIALAGFHVGR